MQRLGSQIGAGLVEVMVALTLFALVASALAVSSVGAIRGNESGRMISTASALVQDRIEQLRSLDPDALPPPADLQEGAHTDPINPMTGAGARGGVFVRQWTVSPDTPRRNIARIEVSVRWNDSDAPVQGVTYVCTDSICG